MRHSQTKKIKDYEKDVIDYDLPHGNGSKC